MNASTQEIIEKFKNSVLNEKYQILAQFSNYPFEEIKDVLFEALEDNNHRIRSLAAKMIGKYGDETVVPQIFHLLFSDSWIVRTSAQEALSHFPANVVIPAIRGMVASSGGNVNVVKNLAAVLVKYDTPEATEALVKIWNSMRDRELRETLIEYIGKKHDDLAISTLFMALKDESWHVRNAAGKALGQKDIGLVLSRAVRALSDPDRNVHMAVIEILIRSGNEDVIDAMAEVLSKGDTLARLNALNVLSGIHTDESLSLIVSALSDKNSSVRYRASDAIANSKSEVVFKLLERCLKSSNWNLKLGTIRTLGMIKTDEAIDLLEKLLQDDDISTKVAVLEVLADIGSRRCLRIILNNANIPDLGEDAIRIIKTLDPDKAINHLISFLSETEFYEQTVMALAGFERAKVLRYLASRIATSSPIQQVRAIETIGRLGGRESEQYLVKVIESSFPRELKDAAQDALNRIQKRFL